MNNKTLIINIFGCPGAGKSVAAAWLFAELKQQGIKTELVTEYAKDKVWEESHKVLHNQIYVFSKQHHRLKILLDKVDIIVNDSPIIMGMVYDIEDNQYLKDLAFYEYSKMRNLNFMLNRKTEFQQEGRRHNESQAIFYDQKIRELIRENDIPYYELEPNRESYQMMLDLVLKTFQ